MAPKPIIDCVEQPVPEKEAHDLLVWLGKPEFNTLVRILESQARSALHAAMLAALQATDGHPLKMNLTDKALVQAGKYRDVLAILRSIKEQTAFSTYKWS